MADAYNALDSLRRMLVTRRNAALEAMSRGVPVEAYHELVGRAKELRETIHNISEQIKQINGGDDGEIEPDKRQD